MPHYPVQITRQFDQAIAGLLRRVRSLESRTAAVDSGWPLAALPAVIDPAYTGTGDPNAFINGATVLTGPLQHLSSYTPAAGDAVIVLPVQATRTYVILSKLA